MAKTCFVDEIAGLDSEVDWGRRVHHSEACADGMTGGADQHRRLSPSGSRDPAVFVDRHDVGVLGDVASLVTDVLAPAVGSVGGHQKLLDTLAVQDGFLREDRHPDYPPSFISVAIFGPFPDPIQKGGVVRRVGAQALTAAVDHLHGGLLQQQALLRTLRIHARHPRTARFHDQDLVDPPFHDPLVVLFRIESVEGELETSFSLDAAVALAGVAAPFGQNGGDVAVETEGSLSRAGIDSNPGLGLAPPDPGPESHLARRQGDDPAGVTHARQFGIGNSKPAVRGQIPLQTIGERPHDDETPGSLRPPQVRLLRDQSQSEQCRGVARCRRLQGGHRANQD